MLEEASLPITAALMATGAAYTPIAALPLLGLMALQTDNEARHRSAAGTATGYLSTKGLRAKISRRKRREVVAASAENESTPLLAADGEGGGDVDGDEMDARLQIKHSRQKAAANVDQHTLITHPEEEMAEEEGGEEEQEDQEQHKLRQLVQERVYSQPAICAVPVDEYQAAVWANAQSSYEIVA